MRITRSFVYLFLFINSYNASAETNGAYMGAQIGYTYLPQGHFIARYIDRFNQKTKKYFAFESLQILYNDSTLGGRVFAGYQFTPYFAMEAGYARFRMINLNTNANAVLQFNFSKNKSVSLPVDVNVHVKVKTEVLDLMAKGIWPVSKKFSLYGKLGVAYLYAQGNVSAVGKVQIWKMNLTTGVHTNPTINVVYPAFGLGASYNITEHVQTDFSWSHVQKYNGNCFPSLDFVAVGLLYYF